MMLEETHHINEDSSINNNNNNNNQAAAAAAAATASSSKEEPPNVVNNIVSELDKLEVMTKKDDEPDQQMVKKLEETAESKKGQAGVVVVEEEIKNKKKNEEEESTIQQVLVLEEVPAEKKGDQKDAGVVKEKDVEKFEARQEPAEKKGDQKDAGVVKEKDVEKFEARQEPAEKKGDQKDAGVVKEKDVEKFEARQVVEQNKKPEEEKCRDVKEEKKLVLEEPQTREMEKDKQIVEEPKIGGESASSIQAEGEQQPNKTDHVVVMEKKINNDQQGEDETKTGGGDQEKPETGRGEEEVLEKSSSFKEENKVTGGTSELKEHEKKALNELKAKIEEAILENKFLIKKKDEVLLEKEAADNDQKLAPKPIEEDKVKSISQEEEKTSTEVPASSEANETTTTEVVVDKKEDEKHTKEEVQEKINDQEKCSPNGEDDEEKFSNVSVEEKPMEIFSVERDVCLWGVPLLPSKGSEATNVIILKFLRARDFKVNEAFEMIRNTIEWRKEFKIDSILEEDFGSELSSVAYMDGLDREGHPICYNMYGIFEDNELYQKTFGTQEKREQFLRWRYQLMEKGIRKLDFNPGGVTSLLQINDLKNSPGPSKKELRMAMKQAVALLQDNYPEFVARNIFVNVPFWYYAFNAVLSPFLTQRTKSKFVFARPSKVTETLLRYIPAEQVPIRYGGLKRENDSEFITDEESVVTELAIKAGLTETIEIPAPEVGTTILWDLAILGWEVNYKAEFVPNDEGSYTIIVQKVKKMGLNEEPVRNSFKSNEPGKIILSIENGTYKKKRAFYRFKTHN